MKSTLTDSPTAPCEDPHLLWCCSEVKNAVRKHVRRHSVQTDTIGTAPSFGPCKSSRRFPRDGNCRRNTNKKLQPQAASVLTGFRCVDSSMLAFLQIMMQMGISLELTVGSTPSPGKKLGEGPAQ